MRKLFPISIISALLATLFLVWVPQLVAQPQKTINSSAPAFAPIQFNKSQRTKKQKLLAHGKKYISAGDIKNAITIFLSALKKFPNDIDVLNHLGIAYSMNKQLTQAQEVFLQVIEQDPKAAGAHMNVARIFGQQGNAEKERYHFSQVVTQEPDSKRGKQAQTRLWLLKGKDFFQKKEYEKGEAEIKKLLKERPNSPAALFALGSAYLEQNRGEEAVKTFTQLAEINPDNFKAQFGLARAYLSGRKFDEAFVQLDKAAVTTQSDIQKKQLKAVMLNAYMNDGTRLSKLGKLKLGQAQFKKAVELDPDNPRAHFGLGGTYLHMKQLDKARELYKRVTELDPTNPIGYKQLGNVLLGLGEFNEAAEAYLTAVTLEGDPEKSEKLLFKAQVVLARAELKAENYDAAEKLFQALIDLNPDEYEPYLYMGFVKNRKGDLDEAVKMYEKLLELKPGYIPGLWFLSLLYEQQGENEKAAVGYRQIVNGSTGKLAEKSKERIRIVDRRLRPDSYAMTYQMGYDDNVNQNPEQPDSDYRTDLFFNMAYQFRPKKNLKYDFSLSPSYSVFHLQQFDFFSYDASASVNSGPVDRYWTLGYSYRKNSRLMLDEAISKSSVYKASGYRRLNMKSISPETWGSDVSSTVTGTLSYTDKESLVGTISDAKIYTVGATLRQPFAMRSNLRLGYTLTRTDNKNEVDSDFANTSHEFSTYLSKSFKHKLSGSLGYQLLYSRFKNPDSFTGFKKRRSNLQNKLSARLNYRLNSQLFFYGQYSWQIIRSEFSSNIVLSGETIATLEQNALVSYIRNNFVLGFRLEF
ncbi:MAG: tetratricopeptide repeat protein [Gammaproteobacteria bacterium]|nr:tetratricopeptide repeat protein [Gammaproteobacteria bacterium]